MDRKDSGMENPWIAGHVAGEMNFYEEGEISSSTVRSMVEQEHAGIEPVPCDCGGTAHYKATIGAMKCPDCGGLYDTQGGKY